MNSIKKPVGKAESGAGEGTEIKSSSGSFKIDPSEIAFDIDGVVADTFRAFIEIAFKDYGLRIHYEDINEYEFWKDTDLDEDSTNDIISRILDQPLEADIRPVTGAVDVLTRLADNGNLLFVTARSDRDSILNWIWHYMPSARRDSIILVAAGRHEDKLPILLKRGIKYFVEDRLETCYLMESSPVKPIVFDQPWNRRVHPFASVNGWEELSDMIDWKKPWKTGCHEHV